MQKEIIEWASTSISSRGYRLKSKLPEVVQDTPWSYVVRFITATGYIYLKQTPAQLALEAPIIECLRNEFHAPVPEIIDHSDNLNCFLMKDAGRPLREQLKKAFEIKLVCKGIDTFTTLQQTISNHIAEFLDMGVPDWRLEKIPELYLEILTQKEMLITDGLTEMEIGELERYHPIVMKLCEKLSDYLIKPTMVQPDFNDNNMLIDPITKKITIIDLGEISISHPFISLLNFLQQMKKHYKLRDIDEDYQLIKQVCFKNFTDELAEKDLLDAIQLSSILFHIYGSLGHYRLMMACDKKRLRALFPQQGRVSFPLKEFLIFCRSNKNSYP